MSAYPTLERLLESVAPAGVDFYVDFGEYPDRVSVRADFPNCMRVLADINRAGTPVGDDGVKTWIDTGWMDCDSRDYPEVYGIHAEAVFATAISMVWIKNPDAVSAAFAAHPAETNVLPPLERGARI